MIMAGVVALIPTCVPWTRIGSEFMPPLEEGTILFMPTTLPGISVARAREVVRQQDAILRIFPEVDHAWGKAGRAETATDPAGLDITETTISLTPKRQWRPDVTYDRPVAQMDSTRIAAPEVRDDLEHGVDTGRHSWTPRFQPAFPGGQPVPGLIGS